MVVKAVNICDIQFKNKFIEYNLKKKMIKEYIM